MKRAGRNAVIAVVAVMSLILSTACGGNQAQKKKVIEGNGQATDSKMSQEDALDAFAAFTGNWMSETHSDVRLGINEDGSWILYKNGGIYSNGELDYHSEDDSVWISPENNTQWSRLYIEDDGSLSCGPIGTFRLADVSEENIPEVDEDFGDDWRNSGIVVDSGIITHENEGSVDVLVTVDENSAAFYRDLSEQILFDSVSFPVTIPGAQEYFNDITFEDVDGDGESDVSVNFVYPSGEYTYMIWIWDPEERYVFQWDLSVFASDDWRNSGIVVDSGIITHENEGSVDVLVTVDENSAAFYRDLPEQILFDSVSFPVTIPGAQEYFNDITFEDVDGDGESDVSVNFVYPSGEYTYMIWIWDPEERYVFQWDLSVFANNINEFSEYFGYWEYPDGTVLEICDDGWWYLYEADESSPLVGGPVEFDEEAAYLMNADGSSAGGKVYFDEDGDLIESDYVLTWLGGLQ